MKRYMYVVDINKAHPYFSQPFPLKLPENCIKGVFEGICDSGRVFRTGLVDMYAGRQMILLFDRESAVYGWETIR